MIQITSRQIIGVVLVAVPLIAAVTYSRAQTNSGVTDAKMKDSGKVEQLKQERIDVLKEIVQIEEKAIEMQHGSLEVL